MTGHGQGAGLGHGQEPTYDTPPPLAARHESLQTSAVTTGGAPGYYYADQGPGAAVMDTRRLREQNFHTLNCLFCIYFEKLIILVAEAKENQNFPDNTFVCLLLPRY